jgi:hypothetical protein
MEKPEADDNEKPETIGLWWMNGSTRIKTLDLFPVSVIFPLAPFVHCIVILYM